MLVTKTEAARLAGVCRATLYSHIKAGKISLSGNLVDTSELIRVYGDLKHQQPDATPSSDVQTAATVDVLQRQIEVLQGEIERAAERERAAQEREARLLGIIEQQNRALTHQSEKAEMEGKTGMFDWLRRR